MAYTPDPKDIDRPVGGDPVGTLPEELRKIKEEIKETGEAKLNRNFPVTIAYPAGAAFVPATGATTVDLANGGLQRYEAIANASISFTHPELGPLEVCHVVLMLKNGGNYTVTWASTIHWDAKIEPVLTENGTDVLIFYKPWADATHWIGRRVLTDIGAAS